jgi:cysteine desulfurase/selenocysteine lyase
VTRIYLDNAATSWPKPPSVYEAVERYQRACGAPAGRSAYREAVEASRAVNAARQGLARLMGVADYRRIVFAANGTDALNMALHGLLRSGNHVVTTVVEHNSVLRPLRWLEERAGVEVTRVGCDPHGVVDPQAIAAALRPHTRLVAVSHASNVTGAVQPIAEIGTIAHRHGCLMLVDAAQSLGHLPCDFGSLPVDLVAAPGHKGLLGPLGTGLLYIAPGIEELLESQRQGGTGSHSDEDRQPFDLPDKFESGNLNVAGLVGLEAGVEFLMDRGVQAVRADEEAFTARLMAGLADIAGVTVFGPPPNERVGVVSVKVGDYDPQEVAAMLDAACRVQVRSGIHCAPLMHRALGTLEAGGTVRFSVGPFTTADEIDAAVAGVRDLAEARVAP